MSNLAQLKVGDSPTGYIALAYSRILIHSKQKGTQVTQRRVKNHTTRFQKGIIVV